MTMSYLTTTKLLEIFISFKPITNRATASPTLRLTDMGLRYFPFENHFSKVYQ